MHILFLFLVCSCQYGTTNEQLSKADKQERFLFGDRKLKSTSCVMQELVRNIRQFSGVVTHFKAEFWLWKIKFSDNKVAQMTKTVISQRYCFKSLHTNFDDTPIFKAQLLLDFFLLFSIAVLSSDWDSWQNSFHFNKNRWHFL